MRQVTERKRKKPVADFEVLYVVVTAVAVVLVVVASWTAVRCFPMQDCY